MYVHTVGNLVVFSHGLQDHKVECRNAQEWITTSRLKESSRYLSVHATHDNTPVLIQNCVCVCVFVFLWLAQGVHGLTFLLCIYMIVFLIPCERTLCCKGTLPCVGTLIVWPLPFVSIHLCWYLTYFNLTRPSVDTLPTLSALWKKNHHFCQNLVSTKLYISSLNSMQKNFNLLKHLQKHYKTMCMLTFDPTSHF